MSDVEKILEKLITEQDGTFAITCSTDKEVTKAVGLVYELVETQPDHFAEIYQGFVEIDLQNCREQSIINILGAISSGFVISIYPDTEELREENPELIHSDLKLTFKEEQ